MIDYGLKDKVAIITGANNPQGIGATTALALAREGAKVVLVYKKILREFDESKTNQNGADRYFKANAGSSDDVENKLKSEYDGNEYEAFVNNDILRLQRLVRTHQILPCDYSLM